jgi:hypothetical protein
MAKNLTITQYREMLEATETTIIKIFSNRIEKLEEKVFKYREENNSLKNELNEVKAALDFQSERHEKVIKDLTVEKEKYKGSDKNVDEIMGLKKENENMKTTMAELEDRNRRNNLRFDGLNDNKEETWEESEQKVKSFLKDKLSIRKDVVIERAHRVRSRKSDDVMRKRTIVVKFLNFKDRDMILSKYRSLKLWTEGCYVNEDYSDTTMAIRKELFKKEKELRSEGKYARVHYKTLISY